MNGLPEDYANTYEFLTSKDTEAIVNPEDLFLVNFKVISKFINLPFPTKGIGLYKLTPFKNSLPFQLTDDQGNRYRVNREMYNSADIGDFVELQYKSPKTYQLPMKMTLHKRVPLE